MILGTKKELIQYLIAYSAKADIMEWAGEYFTTFYYDDENKIFIFENVDIEYRASIDVLKLNYATPSEKGDEVNDPHIEHMDDPFAFYNLKPLQVQVD